MQLEAAVTSIVAEMVARLGRPDLFRTPIVGFSRADDPRYHGLKTLIGPWHQTPREILPTAKSVISYFVPFTREIVSQPRACKDGSALWSEAYQEINAYFDRINDALAAYLTEQGFQAEKIPSTHTYDPRDLKAGWSHRSAAVISGIATLGANRLAITKKGSGGRFCSVITSAPLEPVSDPLEEMCLYRRNGSCGLCFRICPVGALRPEGLDKFVCQDEINKNERLMQQETGLKSADTCGKCISVCPFAYIE